MIKNRIFFFFWACFVVASIEHSVAQDFSKDYSPARNFAPNKETKNKITSAYTETSKKLEAEIKGKKVKKSILTSIKDMSDNFLSLDSLSLIMDSDTITTYLRKITENIQAKNPLLAGRNFKLFTYRTTIPNASSRGENILFINLDIIYKLNSEPELAFIICHEISHDVLNHVIDGLKKRSELFYDPAMQKKIKQIDKMEFNRLAESRSLIAKFLSKYTEHSRENETQADSLGLLFFYNAGYSPADAVTAMGQLDSIDKPVYSKKIDFKKYFNSAKFTFKDEWLKPDNGTADLGGNLDSLEKTPDSLKTHPDCALRVKSMNNLIAQNKLSSRDPFSVGNYSFYKNKSFSGIANRCAYT